MRQLANAALKAASYAEAVQLLESRLSDCMDTYADDVSNEHHAFDFLVADLFETTDPLYFTFTDAKGDKGVDFYVKRDTDYAVYQCKMPGVATLKRNPSPMLLDSQAVLELRETIEYMLSDSEPNSGNAAVRELRSKFHQDMALEPERTHVRFVLSLFSNLNRDGLDVYERLLKAYRSNDRVSIELRLWDRITAELTAPFSEAILPQEVTLHYSEGEILSRSDWAYLLAPSVDLLDAFERNRFALFDLNVRHELRQSPVNQKIIDSLKHAKSQRNFHHLNNGVTITCSSFKVSESSQKGRVVTVSKPQVINGCQTVLSIYRAHRSMSPEEQEGFRKHCCTQVRLIKTDDQSFIGDLVVSTNNQNPMTARNLKSNEGVQKSITAQFKALSPAWFYQRKDGESDSLWHFPPQSFRKKVFEDAGNRKRIADNEEVARAWYGFSGFSSLASERAKLFEDGEPHYDRIFKRVPLAATWKDIADPAMQYKYKEDDYQVATPTAAMYLLSYLTSQFVKRYTLSNRLNRELAIERLGLGLPSEGGGFDPDKVDEKLKSDDEFLVNQMLANMKEVLVGLYATVYVWKFGPIDGNLAQRLLKSPCYARLAESPDFGGYAKEVQDGKHRSPDNLLYAIYEFIRTAMYNFLGKYRDAYLMAERKIRYLHREETIQHMKQELRALNQRSARLTEEWKTQGKTFLDSMP